MEKLVTSSYDLLIKTLVTMYVIFMLSHKSQWILAVFLRKCSSSGNFLKGWLYLDKLRGIQFSIEITIFYFFYC